MENKEMFLKVISITIISLSMVGCGANIKREVQYLELGISENKSKIEESEYQIKELNSRINQLQNVMIIAREAVEDSNYKIVTAGQSKADSIVYFGSQEGKEIYSGSSCITPSLGIKPQPFCETREEAKKFALEYCSLYIGCQGYLELTSDKLDTFEKRFLSAEACTQGVNILTKKGYKPDVTIINAIGASASTACAQESDGFWSFLGKSLGCVTKYTLKARKVSLLLGCRDREESKCYADYINWIGEPNKRRDKCEINLANIPAQNALIKELEWRIDGSRKAIVESKAGVKKNESKIAELRGLIGKYEDDISQQQYRIKNIKKSFQWKLTGG